MPVPHEHTEHAAGNDGGAAPHAVSTATDGVVAASPADAADVLELHALALQHARFEPAAQAVLAQLQRRLACERVSLGLADRGARVRVVALSGGDPQPRQAVVRVLEEAMREAFDAAATVLHPLPPGVAPTPLPAHAALSHLGGGALLASVPVVGPGGPIGVLLLERRRVLDAATLRAAQDAALFVAPWLAALHRLDLSVAARLRFGTPPSTDARHARRHRRVALALAAVCAVVCASAWPVRHEVVAAARLEGSQQHAVAAPMDGYIARAAVRPGASVRAGEVLVQLDDRDAELARQRLAAEAAQHDKQYREALTLDDPPAIALARAKLQQVQVQLAQAERDLARTRLLAPIDGIVIAGDLSQAQGVPVQRGQTLLTLAPAGQLRVVVEVDEHDIAHVARGLDAQVLFAAAGAQPLRFTLTRVSPVALPHDGRNVFEAEGELAPQPPGAAPRPGQRGIARIDVASRPRAALWRDELASAWRRWSWRWLG